MTSPIFFSSWSSASWMFFWKVSRSRLISSMRMEAITWRICPKMISPACVSISFMVSPRRRVAAFICSSGLVPMATVTTLGTRTRMFSNDRASTSWMGIFIGCSGSRSYCWMTGITNAPPPLMQRAD